MNPSRSHSLPPDPSLDGSDAAARPAPSSKESGLTVRMLQSVREVAQPTWDSLVSDDSSPFVEWTWLDALEDSGCVGPGTGWSPAHLSLWRGDDLVAVAPSYVKTHSEGEFVFDWTWAEAAERLRTAYYPKIVVAVPFTPATGDRVLAPPGGARTQAIRTIASVGRELCSHFGASGFHVLFPREAEANAWRAEGYLRRDGVQFHWFRDGARTWDDYLARFPSKKRNRIKRELRDVRECGLEVRTLDPDEITVELARIMYSYYTSTVEKHGMWGRLYLNERFFETIVSRFRHRLAWVVARDRHTGELLGGAFNVVQGRRLYGRYWGASAPGGSGIPFLHFAVCYYEGIRTCIERGIDVFEPGAGGEHKLARGFVPTRTYSVHWIRDRRLRAALEPWLEREREHVTAFVEGTQDEG
ncbi:MAG: GNAT family N-acetyltransferase [Polyangiaceae bacterium]